MRPNALLLPEVRTKEEIKPRFSLGRNLRWLSTHQPSVGVGNAQQPERKPQHTVCLSVFSSRPHNGMDEKKRQPDVKTDS